MTRPAHARRLPMAVLLVAAALVPACNKKKPGMVEDQNDTQPVVPPVFPGAPAPNANTPTPPASTPAVSTKPTSPWAGTAIPFTHRDGITFGPPGCPILIVGKDIFDAKTYKPVRKLSEEYEARALHILTADGKLFASASQSPNQTNTGVTVWATDTGKQVLSVPGTKEAYADLIAFYGNTHLMVGGRHGPNVDVWDLKTRKQAGRLAISGKKVETGKVAFAPDGKHFAAVGEKTVVLAEVATNKTVAEMVSPGETIGRPAEPGSSDPVFVYAWSSGLTFSPDGKELALFSTHPTPRLMVWDTTGQLVLDAAVPMPSFVSHNTTLEWMPDGSGWLVNGYLMDRATRRVVVSIRVPFATEILPHMLDKGRIIGLFGDDRDRLQTITLPWDKLNASLKQMTDKGGAYLSPGEAISLQIDVTGLRGDEAGTKRILTDALTKRLARDGIGVTPGRYTILWLKMSEQAGETLPIYTRQSPFDRRGSDTGRTATEAKGAAVLELWTQEVKQPLWRGRLTATSSRSFSEEITDQTIRKSMLDHLGHQLSQMDLPYYVPKSKDVLALPAVVE